MKARLPPPEELEERAGTWLASVPKSWLCPRPVLIRTYRSPHPADVCRSRLEMHLAAAELPWTGERVWVGTEGSGFCLSIGSADQQWLYGATRWPARLEILADGAAGSCIRVERRLLIRAHVLLLFSLLMSFGAAILLFALNLVGDSGESAESTRSWAMIVMLGGPIVAALDVLYYVLDLVGDVYGGFLARHLDASRMS